MNKIASSLLFIFTIIHISALGQDTINDGQNVSIFDSNSSFLVQFRTKKNSDLRHGKYLSLTVSNGLTWKTTGTYKNNSKSGWWITKKSDTIISKVKFRKGLIHDREIIYMNGKIKRSVSYKNGKRSGTAKYYENGKLIAFGKYSGETLDINTTDRGYTYNFSSGETLSHNFLDQNKQDSILTLFDVWNPAGRVWLRKGDWKYYSTNGELLEHLFYDQSGRLLKKDVVKENEIWINVLW